MSEIRVNNIIDEAGTGAPTFPNGATVTGNLVATATTATTATSLSGTPNITVGTVTGTDATFSGNLTVQGTTTTIDTAVTAVDSLAVDGSVGIGTTNPSVNLHVASGAPQVYIQDSNSIGNAVNATLQFRDSANSQLSYFGYAGTSDSDLSLFNRMSGGALRFGTDGTERVVIDVNGTTKFKSALTEKARYEGVTLNGDYDHDLLTHGNVAWLDTAAGAAFALNLRGSATVDLNDMMSIGESLSFWFAHACASNTAYYMNAFKIDGTTISGTNILWSGGSAPTAAGGGTGTKDVYAFTVFKTANATFRAFAAVTNHG